MGIRQDTRMRGWFDELLTESVEETSFYAERGDKPKHFVQIFSTSN